MNTAEKLEKLQASLEDVRKSEMEFMQKKGQFDQDFQAFLREHNVPEQFHLIDLIKKFTPEQSKIVTLS